MMGSKTHTSSLLKTFFTKVVDKEVLDDIFNRIVKWWTKYKFHVFLQFVHYRISVSHCLLHNSFASKMRYTETVLRIIKIESKFSSFFREHHFYLQKHAQRLERAKIVVIKVKRIICRKMKRLKRIVTKNIKSPYCHRIVSLVFSNLHYQRTKNPS